jgi:hypothetical protein
MYWGHSHTKSKVSEALASGTGKIILTIYAYYLKHYPMTETNTVLLLFSYLFTKINTTIIK